MKKLLMYGMAAALLAGCSSTDDDVLSPEASSEDINATVDVSKLMSDVPIEFGTFGGDAYNMTRGSIDGTFDTTIEDVRVLCLARKAINGNNKTPSWAWNLSAQEQQENVALSVWQNHAKARIVPIGSSSRGNLEWADPTETHFYPSKNWYSYDFVAYHPSADSILYYTKRVQLFFRFDGSQDMIIAKANRPSDDNELAYSSSYFKEVENAERPFFEFKHLTAKLVFKVQTKTAPSMDLYVDSVAILDFPNFAYLRIDRDENTNEVKVDDALNMTLYGTAEGRGDYWLREKDNGSIRRNATKYLVTEEGVQVGDGIMIPPMIAGQSKSNPMLRVWLKDNNGHVYYNAQNISIPCPAGGWQGGKQYNINVKLDNPVIMGAEARVTGWSDVSEPEDIDIEE